MSSENIYQKIMKIRSELLEKDINKSGKNKFGNFNYFELEDLIPPIIQLCKENEVFTCVSFDHEKATLKAINVANPKEMIEISSPMPELTKQDRMNIIQSVGSFETYQRRYLYMAMFDIIEKDSIDVLENKKGKTSEKKGKKKGSNGFKTADKTPKKDELKDDPVARNYLLSIVKTLKEENKTPIKFNIMKLANEQLKDPDNDVDEQMVKRLKNHLIREKIQ